MPKLTFITLCLLALLAVPVAQAATEPFKYNGREYYVVKSDDPNGNSGNKVCAKMGKTCAGYTDLDTKACKYFHPDATDTKSVNGSKAGFYCNGAPQKGLACETSLNNCQVCPQCNVNATCDTQIGDQFREMYVECVATSTKVSTGETVSWFKSLGAMPGRWWGGLRSSLGGTLSSMRQRILSAVVTKVKKATIQVKGPNGTVSVDIPTDVYACEFYQTNKKLVTCGAIKAADTFCVEAMQSRFAKAALCQENGMIVCTNPCHPPESQVKPNRCAFDNDRTRGKQAPPLDFCTETITVKMNGNTPAAGTKKPGQVCAHGGECTTGYCLGQPSDNGIKYFCSCKQNVLDYTCNSQ